MGRARPIGVPSLGCAIALLLLSFLGGCSVTTPPGLVPLTKDVTFSLRPPAEFVGPAVIEQRIELFHQNRRYSLSAVIECDGPVFTVVGLAPMGTRVFALRWNGETLWQDKERIQDLPFDLRYLLVDLQLALFPLSSVRNGFFGTSVEVNEAQGVRIIGAAGETMTRIRYQAGIPWKGKVLFENLLRGYLIEIQTINVSESVGDGASE